MAVIIAGAAMLYAYGSVFAETATFDVEVVPFTPTLTPTPTPASTPTPTPNSGGGGGGGGSGGIIGGLSYSAVEFDGTTFPKAFVTVLRDGAVATTATADSAGKFNVTISNLAGGLYQFGFVSQDDQAHRTTVFSFAVNSIIGSTTKISGIMLPPLLIIAKRSVLSGQAVAITGRAAIGTTVDIAVDGVSIRIIAPDTTGSYRYDLTTTFLRTGVHGVKTRVLRNGSDASAYSEEIQVGVGVPVPDQRGRGKADINNDNKINLIDFSIMAFWYRKIIPANAPYDLNGDGQVTLADFSILAFYWTG